ncbi:MAG: DUF1707 domain-containing protein [Microlunatus sp.]|nr:DUF1707 domain-containing protein [Microlunatus sp.]
MSGSNPVPQRIGDAERDQAAEFLREHLAQGRLDPAEFDERLTAALQAKLQSDLDRLFTDLPSPTPRSPGHGVAPLAAQPRVPERARNKRLTNAVDIVMGAIWPITLLVLFATHWQYWYLIFVPMIVSSLWGGRRAQLRAERERLQPGRNRELGQEPPESPDDHGPGRTPNLP